MPEKAPTSNPQKWGNEEPVVENVIPDEDDVCFEIITEEHNVGVQVIMATHNTGERVKKALKSIEDCLEGWDWVLCIGDDASKDDTFDIIREHKSSADHFLRVQFDKAKSASPAEAKNRVLAMGKQYREKYPWVLFMDDDDIMLPARIEKLLPFAIKNGHKFAVGDYDVIFEKTGATRDISITNVCDDTEFKFGPWSTVIHSSLIPEDGKFFSEKVEAHEDALKFWDLRVGGVHIAPYSCGSVHTHIIREGSQQDSSLYDEEKHLKMESVYQKLKGAKGLPATNIESFSFVATDNIWKEASVLIYSLRQYHKQDIYVVCDTELKKKLKEQFDDNVHYIVGLDPEDKKEINEKHFGKPFSEIWEYEVVFHNPECTWSKMVAMEHALKNHKNTMFLDSDLFLVGAIEENFTNEIVLSPHFGEQNIPSFDGFQYENMGIFNTGYLFCSDKDFPRYWRDDIFLDRSKWIDQQGINYIYERYRDVGIFHEGHNFGFWRAVLKTREESIEKAHNSDVDSYREFLGVQVGERAAWVNGFPIKSFHFHLFNKMYDNKEFCMERVHYMFGQVIKDFLANSKCPKHKKLYGHIEELEEE
jgi:glycosyltransferase involved in cell wall biosynthesis